MSDINKILMTGSIEGSVQVVDDDKGKRAAFMISNHGGFSKGLYGNPEEKQQKFRCICHGNEVERVRTYAQEKMKIGVEGYIRTRPVKMDGGKDVIIFEIIITNTYAIGRAQ